MLRVKMKNKKPQPQHILNNKKVTLSLESGLYDKYSKYCERNAMIVSKKVELFMKKEIEKNKNEKKN